MRGMRTVRLIVAALAVVCWTAPATAQTEWQIAGFNVAGEVSAGARFFIEEPSKTRRAKFEEYREIGEGPFLEGLHLRFFKPDETYFIELDGAKWLQDDQEYGLRVGRLGRWEFLFEWDQTPHIFSTTSRTLATEVSRGNWVLPGAPTRANATSLSTTLRNALNTAPELDEIGVRWDTARVGVRLMPTPDLDITAEYTRIRKEGDRPFSVNFATPGGDFIEIPAPVDHTVHDVRLRATFARENWQVQGGYTFSMFQNDERRVIADNPLRLTDAAFTAGTGSTIGTSNPARGQVSLEPDNMAHTFTLAGGVNLPLRTRITGNVSYSIRLQDEDFLPHTVNSVLLARPEAATLLALPQRSLDGVVHTLLFNLNATTRPIQNLSLSAKYRLYDLNDKSDEPIFEGNVENDQALRSGEERASRFGYTRHNFDLDARYQVLRPLAVGVGAGWERWDRSSGREVEQSDEIFARALVDYVATDWLTTRVTYRPSFRRYDEYNTFAHLAHVVLEEPTEGELAVLQHPLLRKFDEAERNRHRVDLLITLAPLDTLTGSINASWYDDDYLRSTLGIRGETGWSAGFDVSYRPIERLGFFASYVHENTWRKMQSIQRPVVSEVTQEFADFTWISNITDVSDTFSLGATVVLIPRLLDWSVVGNYSTSTGYTDNRNPFPLTSGTSSQRSSATALPWPSFEENLWRIETALKVHFWKVWTAKLGYAFESFQKNDWHTDHLQPAMTGFNSVWLGNDLRNYTAHMVGATLGYQFR